MIQIFCIRLTIDLNYRHLQKILEEGMNIEHLVVAENSSNSLQFDTYTTFPQLTPPKHPLSPLPKWDESG